MADRPPFDPLRAAFMLLFGGSTIASGAFSVWGSP